MNRRFINYFYNIDDHRGVGQNENAEEFYLRAKQEALKQDSEKEASSPTQKKGRFCHGSPAKSSWAVKQERAKPTVAIFSPKGEFLGEVPNQTTADEMYDFLTRVLRDHDEYNKPTDEENKNYIQALQKKDSKSCYQAALMFEDLGMYDKAQKLYNQALESMQNNDSKGEAPCLLGLCRIHRFSKNWAKTLESLDRIEELNRVKGLKMADEIAAERGLYLLHKGDYAGAKTFLQDAVKKFPRSPRICEMHCNAGLACVLMNQRDWANFHWMYVVAAYPDDQLYLRCRFMATMPSENLDLKGKVDIMAQYYQKFKNHTGDHAACASKELRQAGLDFKALLKKFSNA